LTKTNSGTRKSQRSDLRSLGIVWIPGLVAGMLLSGSRPVYAAIYQFVVLDFCGFGLDLARQYIARAHSRIHTG
jgi:hypothetical protein